MRAFPLTLCCLIVSSTHAFSVAPSESTKRVSRTTRLSPLFGTAQEEEEAEDDVDLFDYFDPLLSPHAYPDGISPDKKPVETKQRTLNEEEISPIVKKTFGFDLSSDGDSILEPLSRSAQPKERQAVNTEDVFDPRISPHEYANGTPDKVFGFEQEATTVTRIGILLIDHGSRNPASNDRLEQVARVYQESLNDPNTIVRVAHMEIAEPSVPTALEALLDEGVDEIVCHPYFLSPGRHVKEDIPEIIQGAIQSLDISVPVVTTDAVGMETDIIVRAIHSSVKRTAAFT